MPYDAVAAPPAFAHRVEPSWSKLGDKITAECPIEEVTLTTWPRAEMRGDPALDAFMEYRLSAGQTTAACKIPMDELYVFRGDYHDTVTRRLLEELWPKIRFNLSQRAKEVTP